MPIFTGRANWASDRQTLAGRRCSLPGSLPAGGPAPSVSSWLHEWRLSPWLPGLCWGNRRSDFSGGQKEEEEEGEVGGAASSLPVRHLSLAKRA